MKTRASASTLFLKIHRIIGSSIFLGILFSVFFLAPSASAATYYVDLTGDDTHAGTQAAPWRHVSYGAGRLVAGDTLYVRGGMYTGESVNITQSGTATAPIKIAAYPEETPIIDGQNNYPTADWYGLIHLGGNYIDVTGFEITNSRQRGIAVYGHHNSIRNVNVHDAQGNGVLVLGDYGTVEDSRIWQNARSNYNESGGGMWASGLSFARDDFGDKITSFGIARRNRIYNNWGEGLSAFEASNILFEDNIVYNNWSVNLYISNLWNSRIQRNLVFVTEDTPITGSRRIPSNISWMDEVVATSLGVSVLSHDNVTINNVTWGSGICLQCWNTVEAASAGAGFKNELVANNTFVNGWLAVGDYNHSNSRVVNNIFDAEIDISSRPGIVFSDNLAGGADLAQTGSFSNTSWSADYFNLLPTSVAISTAQTLSQVKGDYFANARDTSPDIGAVEYGSTVPALAVPITFLFANQSTIIAGQTVTLSWNALDAESCEASGSWSGTRAVSGTESVVPMANVTYTLTCTGSGGTDAQSVSVTVSNYGTNIALNRPVTVSSVESASYPGSNAVDSNAGTRWSSKFSDPQWIVIDLGTTRNINRVVLNWEAAYGKAYSIQVSSNNKKWTTIYTTSSGDGAIDNIPLTGTGRYIRMYGTKRGTPYGYSLWDFSVHGS